MDMLDVEGKLIIGKVVQEPELVEVDGRLCAALVLDVHSHAFLAFVYGRRRFKAVQAKPGETVRVIGKLWCGIIAGYLYYDYGFRD